MSAFADILSDLEPAKRTAPSAALPAGGFPNVTPQEQASRDVDRKRILQDELSRATDPRDQEALRLEIANTGGGTAYGRPRAQPAPAAAAPAAPPAAPATEKTLFGSIADDLTAPAAGGPRPAAAPAAPPAPSWSDRARDYVDETIRDPLQVKPVGEFLANQATGLGSTILGGLRGAAEVSSAGWTGLRTLARGGSLADATAEIHAGMSDAAKQARNPELAGGQRAAAYEPTTQGAKVATDVAALPGEAVAWAGRSAGERVLDATGSPLAATAVDTAINAGPLLLMRKGAAASAEPRTVGSGSIADRGAPAAVEARGGAQVPQRATGGRELALTPQEAAKPRTGPSVFDDPAVTPAQAAKQATEAAPRYAETAASTEGNAALPSAEQATRKQILKDVGVTDVRKSALEGDPAAARTDFDLAAGESEAGRRVRSTIEAERSALGRYAEKLVDDTGGTRGLDGQSVEARGHTILAPLEGLREWFTNQTRGLYTAAREKAAGQPVTLNKFGDVLGTDSKFASSDTISLRDGIRSRMKELGMIDEKGNMKPATVEQAENLRQYVNEEWSPRSNSRIRELKNALDEDVTSMAGEDTFGKARKLHQMKMVTLEDPKGIAAILDSEGPGGINRKVEVGKVADKITAMPPDQMAHIVKTLRNVPAELQPQAQAALGEIKAQFANRVAEAKSPAAVSKYLNANNAKMALVFEPAELANFGKYNDAGHILHIGPYPGAAVQAGNLMRTGVKTGLETGGQAVGATVGALFGAPGTGAVIGGGLGRMASGKYEAASSLRAAEKRLTTLADIAKGR